MTKFSSHDNSNLRDWREEYKQFTSDPRDLALLESGPKSLAQSWHMQAMFNKWKRIVGFDDNK